MALVQRYQGGNIALLDSPVQPLKGQTVAMPTNAIGNALAGVAQQFGAMAEDYGRAKDAQNLLTAEQKMQDAQLEFSKWQATEQDESKWLPQWEKTRAKLEEDFGKIPLSDDARLRLQSTFGARSSNQMLNLQGQMVKHAETRATIAAQNTINQAIESGDEATAFGALDTLSQSNLILPERLEASRFELEQTFKNKREDQARKDADTLRSVGDYEGAKMAVQGLPEAERKNMLTVLDYQHEVDNLEVLARKDPRQAASLAVARETAGKITGKDSLAIQDAAAKTEQQFRASQMSDIVKSVQNREPAEVLASKIDMADYLNEADKRQVMDFAKYGPTNDPVKYADLYARAANFSGAEGSPEYAQMLNEIELSADGPQKTSLMGRLAETVKAPQDATSKANAQVFVMAADDLENEQFGSYSSRLSDPASVLPPNIRREVDTLKNTRLTEDEKERLKTDPARAEYLEMKARNLWWDNLSSKDKGGAFTDYMIEDAGKKREAAKVYQSVLADLDSWIKTPEGEKATPQQRMAKYESIASKHRSAAGIQTGFVNPLFQDAKTPTKAEIEAEIAKYKKR